MQVAPGSPQTDSPARFLPRSHTPAVAQVWINPPSFDPAPPDKQEREQELRRIRNHQQRQDLIAEVMGRERPADVIRAAERALDPSSRSFRRELARRQEQAALARQTPPAPSQSAQAAPGSVPHKRSGDTAAPHGASPAVQPDTPRPVASADPRAGSPTAAPNPPTSVAQAAQTAPAPAHAAVAGANAIDQTAGAPSASAAAIAPVLKLALTPAPAAAPYGIGPQPPIAPAGMNAAQPAMSNGAGPEAAALRTSVSPASAAGPVLVAGRSGGLRSAAAARAEHAEAALLRENLASIVRVARQIVEGSRSTAILRLNPPELGNLRLHLEFEKDVLTLRVETQSDVAHRLLRDGLDVLRRSLESAGVHLGRVEVRPPDAPVEAAWTPPPHEDAGDGHAFGRPGGEQPGGQGGEGTTPSSPADEPATIEEPPAAPPRVNVLA